MTMSHSQTQANLLARVNSTKIVYIAYNEPTHYHPGQRTYVRVLNEEPSRYTFGRVLNGIWGQGFVISITSVSCGIVGMAEISDLKHIMPG
jgi:hypothetical protein